MTAHILVVDDEEACRHGIRRALRAYTVTEAGSVDEARIAASAERPDLILLDVNLPGTSGLEYLREIVTLMDPPPVVMITAHGSERMAVEAIKAGAYDYLAKPFEVDELRLVVKNALEARGLRRENARLREALDAVQAGSELLGSSKAMKHVRDRIAKVAATDVTVLICGESGTGKELVARAIHAAGAHRRRGAFVAINCAALPGELIESERFGHERGAFTGAAAQRKGKFELADGGTLFLDEVGDTSLTTQAKLLRVLEERQIERLGGTGLIPVDVRVVSATNRDLDAAVAAERFHADLFYRLQVVQIDVPPLRERREDIPLLAQHFLQAYRAKYQLACAGLGRAALARLAAFDWPGNVRELKNVIERSAVLAEAPEIRAEDLTEAFAAPRGAAPDDRVAHEGEGETIRVPYCEDFRKARREFERAFLTLSLERARGNVTRAAERAGLQRQSLHQKLKELGLSRAATSAPTKRRIRRTTSEGDSGAGPMF